MNICIYKHVVNYVDGKLNTIFICKIKQKINLGTIFLDKGLV